MAFVYFKYGTYSDISIIYIEDRNIVHFSKSHADYGNEVL